MNKNNVSCELTPLNNYSVELKFGLFANLENSKCIALIEISLCCAIFAGLLLCI